MEELKIIDNVNSRLIDDLRPRLVSGSKVSVAAASFSIYAYEVLKKELEQIEEMRFIFTSPTFVKDKVPKEKREYYIPRREREHDIYGSEFEIKLRNKLEQRAIAKECAEWVRRKVCFKSNSTSASMAGFMHVANGRGDMAYMPMSEFTTVGLGCERGNAVHSYVNAMPTPYSDSYLDLFNRQWADKERFDDVTASVLQCIESVYQDNSPEYIYFITLFHIFNEFLEDINEDVLPNEKTGYTNSVIWQKLYNFQRDAALAIINKLEKYNGCILADSVGLGKTFTALAVIKYYENRNKSVLVLCPKKLNDNWQTYRANYKNNPIAADRLRYDVLFHSDLTREHGTSNGLDLSHINWSNYDLLVIDESHNFRNGGSVDEDDLDDEGKEQQGKENRYERLMRMVIRQGVKTKVLMLSATPVNNRFSDLKNQLQLAYEGHADTFSDLLSLSHGIDEIFRNAQTVYTRWSKLPTDERTTQRLLDSLHFDFFQMLDAVTIARSRSHIVKYYDTHDIGSFPHRLPPLTRRPKLSDIRDGATFSEIAQLLNSLNLALYAPSLYLFDSTRNNYAITGFEGITISGRELGVRKLMAANLLKRLESSVNSFRLTLVRICDKLRENINLVNHYEQNHTPTASVSPLALFDGDLDYDDLNTTVSKDSNIMLRDIDRRRWSIAMQEDFATLERVLRLIEPITPAHDTKLQQLIADIKAKVDNPINPGNRKVIVFTAFADTADYLYRHLLPVLHNDMGLNLAVITGGNYVRSTLPTLHNDFNEILCAFSPLSKDRSLIDGEAAEEIDVLIATDCISEGQNLQDADYEINYDIHWNPVRIIQRFGRIDRIGSHNESIQLVNYWPDMELDEYIQLKARVESRMKATVLTSTGDDDLLSANEKGDLEYRRLQLRRLQDEVVDMEDMNTGVNIMDLGLNEFRLDLVQYFKLHPSLAHAPLGMNALVAATPMLQPGTIFILKNRNNAINIGQTNLLHPFYMVYIHEDGTVLCDHVHPKQLLDTLRHACKGRNTADAALCNVFNRETRDGRKMDRYSRLLQSAIESIVNIKEESDIDSLFSTGETTALRGDISGLDDFELITFLIIRRP